MKYLNTRWFMQICSKMRALLIIMSVDIDRALLSNSSNNLVHLTLKQLNKYIYILFLLQQSNLAVQERARLYWISRSPHGHARRKRKIK